MMGIFDFFKTKNVKDTTKINLIKARETKVGISLAKKTDIPIKAKVNLLLDVSGSMEYMFYSGRVQEVVERIFPIASKLDVNQKLDVYIFNNNSKKIKYPVTINNFEGYVNKYINNITGGTSYEPVMKLVVKDCGNNNSIPIFNIMITDGETDDQWVTEEFIRRVSNKHHFFSFVGIGDSLFTFLEKLDSIQGRVIDNASFFSVKKLSNMSDSDLYDKLLSEFPSWLVEARKKNIVK